MVKLVISEKPSVGMALASVLGVDTRRDGYVEGGGYIVSWCFGHLAELASPECYDPAYEKWSREALPIVPNPWQTRIARDKRKQFEILKGLMHREDVCEVINACDAGREGELNFRYVYELAGCKKPMQRLWLSSMEDEAIRAGFRHLRPGGEFDNLYRAALCRAKADWLVGINATRLFSVLYHRTLNVGRVVSPTLALIVQRDAEIRSFQPKPYWRVQLAFSEFTARSEKMEKTEEATAIADACKGNTFTAKTAERREKREKSPALYDLTTLQREANRRLGYTAQQTLDYLQSLYEKKLCTYPRTDSRYLTEDMAKTVPTLAALASDLCKADCPVSVDVAKVCDSSKVSDHHAILPTLNAGKADLSALPAGEGEILLLIAARVLQAVSPDYVYAETKVIVDCGGTDFTAKGRTVLDLGWKLYDDAEPQEKPLPDLAQGQTLDCPQIDLTEGMTQPPASYTEDTLLHAMETAGGKDMPEDAERKGLGTPATRAATVEKLIAAGFVERKKGKRTVSLVPAHVGQSLITILPEQLQSPLLTAEWEHKLKEIEKGALEPEAFLSEITAMLEELVKSYQVIPGGEVLFPSGRTVVGKCPRCGGDVTESRKGFFCERRDCRFGLWRDNKYLAAKRVNLKRSDAESLLRDGRVHMDGLYSEKTGKTYSADLLLDDNGERTVYRVDFSRKEILE